MNTRTAASTQTISNFTANWLAVAQRITLCSLLLGSLPLGSMAIPCAPANADEGMWLFNALPKNYLKDTYDFTVTDEWANHIMLSSVRFNSGGSASFVSSNGLVLTNHHVGAETLHKLSDADNNYYKDGFYAKTMSDEIKAPDLELNQLVSISDVTAKVNGVVKPGMNAGAAAAARRAAIAKIENDSLEETKLRSNVVTLYGGARYHLYRYKKYTDVRLVWSPESAIAFFGGDADNFEYPRYCLDVCIFRVYENDEPAKVEHFLKVSKKGAGDGELVLVSGNPGRTQRIFTVAALKHQRDHRMPYVLDFLRRREILFQQFSLESDEKKRRGQDELFGLQNSRKAFTGMLKGLQNPSIIADKQKKEDQLRRAVGANPRLKKYATAWQQIEEVQARRLAIQGQTGSFASRRFDIAMELVLLAAEDAKPNEKRLPQYRDSNRESLEQQLFSPAPIYDDVELVKFADSIELFVERRGGDNELVRLVLDGQSPSNLAAAVLNKTKLADIDERKRLAKSGAEGISASKDPMIRLALIMEPEFRRLRKVGDELNEVERQAYSQIADALFAVQGASTYPDATFTLRLAYGPVKGYEEGGQRIPPWTTMGGAFDHEKRHNAKDDWQLPKSWKDRKDKLNLDTPFNFVCTADIIGGNSGSPVVNRAGELVGVIFDGNIQSLTADYMYSDEQGRATSVHSSAVIEALRKIYDAKKLADQLGN